jgi:adenosylmethionine-8-amino-7-oxononanoate aminotransferase
MQDWCAPDYHPVTIIAGEGARLHAADGRTYWDGNSSIWVNLHGHRVPELDAALVRQLARIAHSSFLGLTNDVAPPLAERLARMVAGHQSRPEDYVVFFSDDGSTAIEAGLKAATQARLLRGETERTRFISLASAYHGDTLGAMSLGQSGQFHAPFRNLMFESLPLPSPGCYRCPWNLAQPQKGIEARQGRRCSWECLRAAEQLLERHGSETSVLIVEPRVQGPAGMVMHPPGWLHHIAALCRKHGVWLMLDEVMTAWHRTGPLLAHHAEEEIHPDIVAVAKGLTGGYLPLAATLFRREIYNAFLGDYGEFKAFFHGHSYSGNALGCAVAQANLDLLERADVQERIKIVHATLRQGLQRFWEHPNVGDVRVEGGIGAVELVEDFPTRRPWPAAAGIGHRVCAAARQHGILTRPIGNVLLLMPPFCCSSEDVSSMIDALWKGLCDVLD